METQLYYRPTDLATAEHIERSLGRQSAYAHSTTERGGAETSEGLTEQGVPLLTAQEIRQLKDEEVIGFHRHLPPFRMKWVDWRQSPILQQRRSMQAPELPTLPHIVDIPDFPEESQTALQYGSYIDPDMPNAIGEITIIDFSRKARNKDRRN
jgi:type IV secretory pathway TraG/TraD family ATPase VirD4